MCLVPRRAVRQKRRCARIVSSRSAGILAAIAWCMIFSSRLKMPRLAVPFRSFAERCQEWDEFLNAAPVSSEPAYSGHDGGTLRSRVKSILLERFIWADTLAEFYAHSYRSAYVTVYLLSATAVFIALAGAV